jgi:hypothetical protein
MARPGERELASHSPGYAAAFDSPNLTALASALAALADVSDNVARAITRHDRQALEAANVKAELLLAQVDSLSGQLTAEDHALIGPDGLAPLAARLAAGSRRNAILIENAWATDAALMRLIIGAGKDGLYREPSAPAYVDRQA